MRKGITQEQVNAAADVLVTAGEKPTVEKIRQALGTGSPNTVTRMLDVWRGTLAQRLDEVIKLPDVPPEVAQTFADVWRLALAEARALAAAALERDHNALFAEQTSLAQERKVWEIAIAEAQANAADSATKLAAVELQARERQVLIEQLSAQSTDLQIQRDRLEHELARQRGEFDALRSELLAFKEHSRASEDRAHQEVDRARQELKALQQRFEREQRDHARTVELHIKQESEWRAALRTAEHTAAHQAGRVAALEVAVSQWRPTKKPMKRTPVSSRNAAKKSTRSVSKTKGSRNG